jgi:catechol 2,3-dioxygenase-like lactoylglutathione lyase family enzyme
MLRPVRTTAEPLVSRISVVYLYVSDMERSAAFYRDLLGIPLEGDDDWQECGTTGARCSR